MPPEDQRPADNRPYLCIPYWNTPVAGSPWDTGEVRPLPAAVVSYLCDGIRTSAYTPGEPIDVEIDVRNSGDGVSSAVATVVAYWAVPSAGFASPQLLGAASVAVAPARGTSAVATARLRGTIPATAPAHVCLLVKVTHPRDPAGAVADPVGDRHWAQRNLVAATAVSGAPVLMPLLVGNPFAEERDVVVVVRGADERRFHALAERLDAAPASLPLTARLLDEAGGVLGGGERPDVVRLALGPGEARPLQLFVEVESEIERGEVVVVEVEVRDRDVEGAVVGSLGLALTAPAG